MLPARLAVEKSVELAAASSPRSEATPEGTTHGRQPYLRTSFTISAVRASRLPDTERKRTIRGAERVSSEATPRGTPHRCHPSPFLAHLLRHSRPSVTPLHPAPFPSFLYAQNIYIYFAPNIDPPNYCFFFLAFLSFSRGRGTKQVA